MKIFNIIFLLTMIVFNLTGFSIYVIQSENNKENTIMLSSFKDRAEFDITYFNLNDEEKNVDFVIPKILNDKPSAVLLVGDFAVKKIASKIDNIPLILSMINSLPSGVKNKKNICGVLNDVSDRTILRWIKNNVPYFDSLGLIFYIKNIEYAKKFKNTASEESIFVEISNISDINDLKISVKLLKGIGIKALWVENEKQLTLDKGFENLIKICKTEKLPIITSSIELLKNGALFSLTPEPSNHGYLSGNIAIRLANGEKPEDIGFILTEKVKFSYNKSQIKNYKKFFKDTLLELSENY